MTQKELRIILWALKKIKRDNNWTSYAGEQMDTLISKINWEVSA